MTWNFSGICTKKFWKIKVLLQTYFGDVRDCYKEICELPFDGIGHDFIEGKKFLELVRKYGFPTGKILFAGVINGKNIWRNNYGNTLPIISESQKNCGEIALSTSCSLLHVPYTVNNEKMALPPAQELNINLIYLPPYSSNLNLIERFWKFLRKKILACKYYSMFQEFFNKVGDFIDDLHITYFNELSSLISFNFEII